MIALARTARRRKRRALCLPVFTFLDGHPDSSIDEIVAGTGISIGHLFLVLAWLVPQQATSRWDEETRRRLYRLTEGREAS